MIRATKASTTFSAPRDGRQEETDETTHQSRMLSVLNKVDEAISTPIFRLALPKGIEFFVSIPANLFGSTANLMVGPLWIALLALTETPQTRIPSYHDQFRILQLKTAAFVFTVAYLIAWGLFQLGNRKELLQALFYNSGVYALAYLWVVGILAITVLSLEDAPKEVFSIAVYPLVMWPLVCVPMMELKKVTRRSRPALKDIETNEGRWTAAKAFPNITRILAKHNGDESFPSGDVAMAAMLAVPIWKLQHQRLAMAIVVSSAFGRMYVLAHHLFDVLSGLVLTIVIHWILTHVLGYNMDKAEWWYPLFVMVCFVAFVETTKKGKNPWENSKPKGKTSSSSAAEAASATFPKGSKQE